MTAISFLILTTKLFKFTIVWQMKYFKEILRDGLVNMPFLLSRVVICSLTIVLLGNQHLYMVISPQIDFFIFLLIITG
jgi:hypothetical protein